jgi:hypothetical protein
MLTDQEDILLEDVSPPLPMKGKHQSFAPSAPSRGFRAHSYWVAEPGLRVDRRQLAMRLVGLGEVLESAGQVDEGKRVVRAGLRGYTTVGEQGVEKSTESNEVFLTAIERYIGGLAVDSATVRNTLIRLYSRLLHATAPDCMQWSTVDHAILRCCVLHAISGGTQSALADLERKVRIWRFYQGGNRNSEEIEKWLRELDR